MGLFRPSYLGIASAAYFTVVAYFSWQVARRTTSSWYLPEISQTVYQTTMVAGVLVLLALFVTASISPQIKGARPPGSKGSVRSGPTSRTIRAASDARPDPHRMAVEPRADRTTFDDLIDGPDPPTAEYGDFEQAQDAASISAALSRMVPTGAARDSGTLGERLAGIRARNTAVLVSEGRETAAVLLRLVNDMRPLMAAAKRMGLEVPELKQLVAEAAAGHEGDLARRVRVVEQVKGTLEAALVERIAESLQSVLFDIERTKAATKEVHAAEMTAAEAVALLDTGNYTAALDRASRARETLERNIGLIPEQTLGTPGASSFVALAGPSFAAVAFVSLSAMLLPGVGGFLTTNFMINTAAILALSYSWLGLMVYALASIYYVLRPPSSPAPRDRADRTR